MSESDEGANADPTPLARGARARDLGLGQCACPCDAHIPIETLWLFEEDAANFALIALLERTEGLLDPGAWSTVKHAADEIAGHPIVECLCHEAIDPDGGAPSPPSGRNSAGRARHLVLAMETSSDEERGLGQSSGHAAGPP